MKSLEENIVVAIDGVTRQLNIAIADLWSMRQQKQAPHFGWYALILCTELSHALILRDFETSPSYNGGSLHVGTYISKVRQDRGLLSRICFGKVV